jgi:hypothetical protein
MAMFQKLEKYVAISLLLAFFGYAFLQVNAFFGPQTPDAASGHVVPHVVKGVLVYVTALEDHLLTFTYGFALCCFVFLALRRALGKKK